MRIILILFMLTWLACSPAHHEVKVNEQYAITLPADMQAVANLHEYASLQQADSTKPLYVVVIDESKAEMQKHELDYDLSIYFNNLVAVKFIEALPGVTIAPPVKIKINGADALVSGITGTTASGEVYYKVAVIETPSSFYQVLIWTTASQKNEMEKEMDKIIHSFRELSQDQ